MLLEIDHLLEFRVPDPGFQIERFCSTHVRLVDVALERLLGRDAIQAEKHVGMG